MNNEWVEICNEAFVAYSRYFSGSKDRFPGQTDDNQDKVKYWIGLHECEYKSIVAKHVTLSTAE
jgi:hypothetical protein